MSHRGPIQQYTEMCLYCLQNIYTTNECVSIKTQIAREKKKADKEQKRRDKGGWYPNQWPDM